MSSLVVDVADAMELYVEEGVDDSSVTAWQQPGSYIEVFFFQTILDLTQYKSRRDETEMYPF